MSESQDSLSNKSQHVADEDMGGAVPDSRPFPGPAELLRPAYVFRWIWEFVEAWFFSRSYGRLLLGLPFLIVAIGGSSYVWWLRRASQAEMIETYERAADKAREEERPEDTQLYLRSLVQQRPYVDRYRYVLATHLLDQDQPQAAAAQMLQMAPLDQSGFVPARVWLARQALTNSPAVAVTEEQAMAQLLKAISEEPDDVDANQVLAEFYLRKQQFRQAEAHLLKVASARPEIALLLAKVQMRIGRSKEQIDGHLESARQRFEQRVRQNPRDDAARVAWAEVLTLSDHDSEAQAILLEGMQQQNSPKLQSALAGLYTNVANKRLQQSPLNRDQAADLLVRALSLQPANGDTVRQMLALKEAGAAIPVASLQPALELWKERVDSGADNVTTPERLLVIQLLAASDKQDVAIQRLEELVDAEPSLRLTLAKLYRNAGRVEEADQLLSDLLAEQRTQLEQLPGDKPEAGLIATHAETLLVARQVEEARSFLQQQIADRQPTGQEAAVLQALAGRAIIAVYDQQLADSESSESEASESDADKSGLVDMLKEALQTRSVNGLVLERLARLSCSSHVAAPEAEEAMRTLLASGNANSQIYNFLGACALEAEQVSKARQNLERAYGLDPHNPQVLNNLALALVRESPRNAERALKYTDEGLDLLPDHADVLSTRAEVLIAMERWEEARRDLELALAKSPRSRTIHKLLVTVSEALGDDDLADEHRRILQDLGD